MYLTTSVLGYVMYRANFQASLTTLLHYKSERLGVIALKSDLNIVRSSGNKVIDVPIGSIQINLNLSEGAKNALDLCQLRLSFSANRVNALTQGQCSGTNYAGNFARDQKDYVGNYRFNK